MNSNEVNYTWVVLENWQCLHVYNTISNIINLCTPFWQERGLRSSTPRVVSGRKLDIDYTNRKLLFKFFLT